MDFEQCPIRWRTHHEIVTCIVARVEPILLRCLLRARWCTQEILQADSSRSPKLFTHARTSHLMACLILMRFFAQCSCVKGNWVIKLKILIYILSNNNSHDATLLLSSNSEHVSQLTKRWCIVFRLPFPKLMKTSLAIEIENNHTK